MSSKSREKKQIKNSYPEWQIQILGSQKLLNELLAQFLAKKTGLKCVSCQDPNQVTFAVDGDKNKKQYLILRDCKEIDPANPWAGLGIGSKSNRSKYRLVLFNVPPDQGIEKKIALRGVQGIFYENDPLERFLKGIPSILDGEFWFSRSAMLNSFLEPVNHPVNSQASLTHREKEILLLIASGATNGEIAEKLFISHHTVKNHSSRIYSKINVTNRLQASMWAVHHFNISSGPRSETPP